ncbi:MAG: conjugal transfer protein TraG N-terminal domain-containing protein [Alphaproteobacteria bacterium]|nr:conjugal transfer protein TraG N-terminal domain-containing protein [Alphaproteobacteria bacterium]
MTLWTYGGGTLLTHIFNSLAMVFGANTIPGYMRFFGLISVIWAIAHAHIRQSVWHGAAIFMWFVFASHALFIPTTTLMIHDTITQRHHVVSNVPWALGIMASTISSGVHALTKEAETSFTIPHHHPYHETGLVFGSRFALSANKPPPLNHESALNFSLFIKRCVVQHALIGTNLSFNDLKKSKNVWETIKQSAHPTLGFYWRKEGSTSFVSCQQAIPMLDTALTQASQQREHLLKHAHPLTHPTSFLGNATQQQALFSSQDLVHVMVCNALASENPPGLNLIYGQSRMQQHWSAQLGFRIAEEFLPALKTFLEALAYASFVFVALLALLPGGWKTFITFMGLFAWMQSWPFFFTILNMIMTSAHSPPQGTPSLATAHEFFSSHAHIVDIAGLFALSVPAISYMMLKGGAGAILHLAHHLGTQIQSLASQQAHQLSSGNFSLSNTSTNTHAAHQQQAFQHNTRPHHQGEGSSFVGNDGSIHSSFANSHAITQQGPGITLSQLEFSVKTDDSLSTIFQQESAIHQQQAEQFSEQFQNISDQATSLAKQEHSAINTSNTSSNNSSLSHNRDHLKAVQNITSFQDYLSRSHGFSAQEAQRIAWGMSMSLPLPKLFGPSYTQESAQNSQTQQAIEDIQQQAKQFSVQDSWNTIMSTSHQQSVHHATSDSESSSSDLRSLLQTSRQALDSWQASNTKTHLLSEASQRISSQHKGVSYDQTEEFLRFTMEHKNLSRHEAIHLLNNQQQQRSNILENFWTHQSQQALQNKQNDPLSNRAAQDISADINHVIKKMFRNHTPPPESIDKGSS